MDDLISRQAAIDAINRYGSVWMEYTEIMSVDELAERALKASKQSMVKILHDLPSAQPKIGKWILDRSGAYCCSECMEPCAGYVMMKPRDKFCKMCGAKMEGEHDG